MVPSKLVEGAADKFPYRSQRSRSEVFAARAHGDSMKDIGVKHGDILLFERVDPAAKLHNGIMLIERVGDEEGFGSWALKRIEIVRPRLARHDSLGNEIDFEEQVIVLHSRNREFLARDLDPTGKYRVHGKLLRKLSPDESEFVDSEDLRRLVEGTEIDPD